MCHDCGDDAYYLCTECRYQFCDDCAFDHTPNYCADLALTRAPTTPDWKAVLNPMALLRWQASHQEADP